jgi:hypothetical protein
VSPEQQVLLAPQAQPELEQQAPPGLLELRVPQVLPVPQEPPDQACSQGQLDPPV